MHTFISRVALVHVHLFSKGYIIPRIPAFEGLGYSIHIILFSKGYAVEYMTVFQGVRY